MVNLPDLEKPVDPARLFGRQAPFEVEIGVGSGFFLSRYARANPGVNILGIDNVRSEAFRSADKCRRHGLFNVRVLGCDAPYFLANHLPDACIDACHIYFSDPWPKKRHHKRRLWSPSFLPILERVLAPGGLLLMKTDVTAYFEVIDELLRSAPFLRLEDNRRLDAEPMDGDIITNFQNKALAAGHPIYYQRLRRV